MRKIRTNLPDWSGMIPLLLEDGPQGVGLYAALRGLVESGRLQPGAKLPPSRELAGQLSVSRGAVVVAFEQLVADGFAEARVGSGTFVARAVPRVSGQAASPDHASDARSRGVI
jgi:GntR family transcriptional regulator/MocR family aminotransferase